MAYVGRKVGRLVSKGGRERRESVTTSFYCSGGGAHPERGDLVVVTKDQDDQ